MRHLNSGRQLGRNSPHRRAMIRNMVTSLIEHGRITTTETKAKEIRPYVERTITYVLRLGDLLGKPKEQQTREEQLRVVHALRLARRFIRTREVVHKLHDEVAPKLKGRPGGYTRIMKVGRRPGDGAPMAILELVTYELPKADDAAA